MGSAGTVRATGLTYPNGRSLSFDYGATGSIDDAAGRIGGIVEGTTTLAGYGDSDHDFHVASSGRRVPYPATAFDCHYDPSRLRPSVSRLLRDRDTSGDGVLDERLYALQDGNWNVTAVTDASGDVQERYAYTAYGEPLFLSAGFVEQSGSSFRWEVLFTGQRWDGGIHGPTWDSRSRTNLRSGVRSHASSASGSCRRTGCGTTTDHGARV